MQIPSFENNIFGLIPKEEWLDVGFNVSRPNDPVDALFPDEYSENLVAKWQEIANQYQLPVMADFRSFDSRTNIATRIPVDTHSIEKGLIKVKINQSERMRALLRSGVQNDAMYDYVIRDGIMLADQVVTRTKVAKNEVLEKLRTVVQESLVKGQYGRKNLESLLKLINENIETQEFWDVFQNNFDLIHEKFFRNLRERYPSLTATDLRFCALLRLNLSTKDIAQMTNLTIRGVEAARYRLRKKLDIPDGTGLVDFLIDLK